MTYIRSEHCSSEQEFAADSSGGRDIAMIMAAFVCIAAFCVIWSVTA